MKSATLYLSTALAGTIAFAAPATAQTAAPPETATDRATPVSEPATPADNDIVVTAQRRAESVQDVPIAIAAFTGGMVEASGAVNITGLNGLAPNVVVQTQGLIPNVAMFSIRGMSSADPDPNSDPKISTIIDGVYVPFVASSMLDTFDIERVEILKGPQGVLFGKNNLAGTINVITARPTDDFGVAGRLTVGSHGLLQVRGVINSGRFADDSLAAKISVNYRDYNGYTRNVITGTRLDASESRAVRGALNFDRGGAFNSTLVMDWNKQDVTGPAFHTVDNGSAAWAALPPEVKDNVRLTASPFDPYANTESYGGSWTSNLDVGYGEISAVLGYRHLTYVTRADFDGLLTPVPGFDVTREFSGSSRSAELRYASPSDQPVDFVVGAYFQSDKWHQDNSVLSTPVVRTASQLRQQTTSYALFMLVNAHPVEGLTLSMGGRYSHDRKEYSIASQAYAGAALTTSFTGDFDTSWAEFTPRLTVQYEFNRDIMMYANYSEGYKSGGFNSRGTVLENVGPYNPERVRAYEIGIKSDLFGRMLRFNLAGFLNRYNDLQSGVTRMGSVRAENVITNVAAARTWGIEAEMTLRPSTQLTLGATLAYLNARYTNFCADTDGVFGANPTTPLPGQCGPAEQVFVNGVGTGTYMVPMDGTYLDMSNAPKWSGSVTADYRIPMSFGEISLHGDARYSARYNTWGRSINPAFYRDEVVLLNANIAIAGHEDRWKLTVYGQNLTNRTVMSGAVANGPVPILQFYQPPREFGVDLAFKF